MSTSGIVRSEQNGQFVLMPDGMMVQGHNAGNYDPTFIESTRIHDYNRNFTTAEIAFHNDERYVEQEFILVWDAPQSECLTLFAVVVFLICLDAFISKRVDRHSYKTHAAMVCFWILCGFGYNALYAFRHGMRGGIDWFIGYVLEWMLSLDNLFAFQFIMRVYSAPLDIQHKALFCGVLGAMVWRLLLFFAVGWMMHSIHYVQFVFGFILIYAGIQAVHGDDEDRDPNDMLFIRLLKKCLGARLLDRYDMEDHSLFLYDEEGRLCATLLVPLIFCVEFTDIIFAIDSVSAKVAQIPNQYIAYSSSVLAILGLRGMYFVIDDLVRYFESLKYGVCFILVFIGGELMISGKYQLPDWIVCIVIISVFNFCIVLSILHKLIWPEQAAPGASDTADAFAAVQAQVNEVVATTKKGQLKDPSHCSKPDRSNSKDCNDESESSQTLGNSHEHQRNSLSTMSTAAGSGEPPVECSSGSEGGDDPSKGNNTSRIASTADSAAG